MIGLNLDSEPADDGTGRPPKWLALTKASHPIASSILAIEFGKYKRVVGV